MHTAYTKVGLNAGFDHCSKNSMQNDWNCSEVFQMQNRRNYQKCVYDREKKKSNFSLQSVWGNWFLQLLDFTISIRSIKRLTFYDEYAVSVRKSCQQIYIEFFVSPFLSISKGTPIGCSEYRKIVLWLVLKSYFSINLHIHGHNYYHCYCHIQSNFIFDWLLCKSIWTRALDSLHTVTHSHLLLVVNGVFATQNFHLTANLFWPNLQRICRYYVVVDVENCFLLIQWFVRSFI